MHLNVEYLNHHREQVMGKMGKTQIKPYICKYTNGSSKSFVVRH